MDEREKIINIIEQTEDIWHEAERMPFGDEYHEIKYGALADALLAANIGDVTEWKERVEKEKTEKNKWKCTANDWKQRFESREKQLGELRTTSCDVVIRKNKIISEQKAEIARLTAEDAAHRAEVAEKERNEWKERAEKAGDRLKIAKQKLKKTNMCYGTARLEHLNGDPYEILCPHCGENIKFHVSNTCPYCNALLFKKTGREEKDKYSDILQLKSFCERNGIKCILTRRIEDFKGKLKERDGYKITFLNGDVIQCADTNGYFEFYNCHNEVDGKWIELPEAKSFVLRYKNWLDLNNKPKRKIEEEEADD